MERARLHRSHLDETRADSGAIHPGRSPLLSDVPTEAVLERAADGNGVQPGAEAAVARATTDGGSSLPAPLMRKFEGSLGVDLSAVRVHTGATSAAAAASVGARAYTVAQDIHFGHGQYDPDSQAGQHLIAHEVAHTVQQAGGAARKPMFKLEVSSPGDSRELEADCAADAMLAGRATALSGASRSLSRQACPEGTKVDIPPATEGDARPDWMRARCVADPYPERNWGEVCPQPVAPSGDWGGAPDYAAETPADEVLNAGRFQFSKDWKRGVKLWRNLSIMCGQIESERNRLQLGDLRDNTRVHTAGQQANASASFKGNDLAFRALDRSKLKPEDNIAIEKKKVEVAAAEDGVKTAKENIREALRNVTVAGNAVKRAVLEIKIKKEEGEQARAEQSVAVLEQNKQEAVGYIQAGTQAAQGVTSIIGGAATGEKGAIIDGVNSLVGGVGKGLETAVTRSYDNEIRSIQDSISKGKQAMASAGAEIAALNKADAMLQLETAADKAAQAERSYAQAIRNKRIAYMELGELLRAASEKSGQPDDATKMGAAVEAIPQIERIIMTCGEAARSLAVPEYTRLSGIGAAQAANVDEFISHIAVVMGGQQFIANEQQTWVLRLNKLNAMIGST